ncbi:MAG: AAA family ATPase [Spirochaetales bacterium]|nr:AAA family ATPase [Spirochaetales bacterium]
MKRKILPLGVQSFEEFKAENLLYVDKTRLIYNLVKPPKGLYFLSRPRRFGKTLHYCLSF